MPSIWLLIVPAVALLLIGCKLGPKDVHDRTAQSARMGRLGNMLAGLAGFLVLVGLYAGFRGPVFVGPVMLPSSPMMQKALQFQANTDAMHDKNRKNPGNNAAMKNSYANAGEYAMARAMVRGNFVFKKDINWFEGSCRNNGNKDLSSIEIAFHDGARHTVRRVINRSFPSGKEIKIICKLPNVFNISGSPSFQVTGASY